MNFRQLILRSNRFLGSALVEKGLINESHLDRANERLLELFHSESVLRPRLLHILVNEMQVLDEGELLGSLAQGAPVGLINLDRVALKIPDGISFEECLSTSSIPFDRMEDHTFVASTYYLSTPIRDYWKERLSGPIEWYVTSLGSMDTCLEDLRDEAGRPAESGVPAAAGAG